MKLTEKTGKAIKPQLTFLKNSDAVIDVDYPYFGGRKRDGFPNNPMNSEVMVRKVPAENSRSTAKMFT